MQIVYIIVGKIKGPITDEYEIVGQVDTATVDYGECRNVTKTKSSIIARKKRCISFTKNKNKKIVEGKDPCHDCSNSCYKQCDFNIVRRVPAYILV